MGVPFFWNCNDFNPSVGGITRPVQVFFKPDVYLTLPLYSNLQTKGLYVYGQNFDLDNATADIRVEAEVRNEGKVPVSAQLRITLRRPDAALPPSLTVPQPPQHPQPRRTAAEHHPGRRLYPR